MMKIENVKIQDLKCYKLNSKAHPQKQIEGLAESIRRFGFTQPIVVDSKNEIIIGHGRLAGANLAGLKEVPVLRMENLSESEVRTLRIMDNRISETGWDNEILLEDLKTLDADFSDFNIDFDFAIPDFEPVSQNEQPRLDKKQMTECPNCSEIFDHAKHTHKSKN